MLTIDPDVRALPTRPDPGTPDDPVRAGTRRLLAAFALLTALATHSLLVLGRQTGTFWAWTITSAPTAAFLGAAYAAGCLLSVLALRQRCWARVQIAVATVTVFTVLTLLATLIHLHKLHLSATEPLPRTAAWIWLAVYLTVPAICGAVLLAQTPARHPAPARPAPARPAPARRAPARRPLPAWLRALLTGQGTVLGAAGAVLFAGGLTVHHGTEPLAAFWPWPLTPLSAQVIGAWLIAFAVATALVLRDGDLTRLRVPAAAYTAFGALQLAVLAGYRTQLDTDDPSLWTYAALLASITLAGGYGWWKGSEGSADNRRPMVGAGPAGTSGVDTSSRRVKVIGSGPEHPRERHPVAQVTEAMVRVEGEAVRPLTRVVVEGAPSGDRARSGTATTTPDVLASAGGTPVG